MDHRVAMPVRMTPTMGLELSFNSTTTIRHGAALHHGLSFPSDQHAPGYVRPGFGSTDDSLESPPCHGKTLHTSMGWLEKALGEAPMAHHPDPPWCKGRQPASPPYNRLICQNAPCTSGYPFC
ncbi:hypothetical protein RIF29_42574 [Crotalaria pallida]|uniref:Uncharacterized protein n=1 Tax=Crotalaria pallida TaxID=3830 RepID=A0AAN9DZK1_CROPI